MMNRSPYHLTSHHRHSRSGRLGQGGTTNTNTNANTANHNTTNANGNANNATTTTTTTTTGGLRRQSSNESLDSQGTPPQLISASDVSVGSSRSGGSLSPPERRRRIAHPSSRAYGTHQHHHQHHQHHVPSYRSVRRQQDFTFGETWDHVHPLQKVPSSSQTAGAHRHHHRRHHHHGASGVGTAAGAASVAGTSGEEAEDSAARGEADDSPIGPLLSMIRSRLFSRFSGLRGVVSAPDEKDEDAEDDFLMSGAKRKRRNPRGMLFTYAAPVIMLIVAGWLGLVPTRFFGLHRTWKRLSERRLEGRQCVMNLFVDKHEANEFNPDYSPSGNVESALVAVAGSYRTKGQVEVINRFISSVAAAFRPNVDVQQHIVFARTRDGGHLAESAMKYWPARGSYRTQVHVLADDVATDELDYETLQAIEDRFGKYDEEDIHIYDANGNRAGKEEINDDDGLDEELRGRDRGLSKETHYTELPEMRRLLIDDEEYEDSIIPYMHIDGTSMESQMAILERAMPLLHERKAVVVGLEHSPGLSVHELIQFFQDVHYKTFMLGLRQLTRIDNLCPEILDNILAHPTLDSGDENWFTIGGGNKFIPRMPPFFVAMPKGRHNREEMSIQHMYDLFSGSSGLQVKTANDRVVGPAK